VSLSYEDHVWIEENFKKIHEALIDIRYQVQQIEKDVQEMTPELQGIIDEVAHNTDVAESAKSLLGQLFAFVEAHINDPAALQSALDQLKANDQGLVDAVVANTPAAPAPVEPPVEPPVA
jgi:hypothetical protein